MFKWGLKLVNVGLHCRYEDAVFHVTAMGFPPAELAANSRAYFGNVNFFGGPHEHSVS